MSILRDEVVHILEVMAFAKFQLNDNCLRLRPNKPNSRPFHRLHQLYNLTPYTFAFIVHNLGQSKRIVSLQRMQFRLLQLLDHAHVALHGSSLEQAFEVRSIAYEQVSVLDDYQR